MKIIEPPLHNFNTDKNILGKNKIQDSFCVDYESDNKFDYSDFDSVMANLIN